MTITLAVPRLFDAVAAQFAAAGVLVPMYFGWNASSEQLRDAARITWIPGDEQGSLGKIGPPKYPSMDQLRTLYELVTLEITSADITDLTDERRQYQIVRELHDITIAAVHAAATGTYQIISDKWVPGPGKKQARRFGQTLRIVLEIQSPISAGTMDWEARAVTDAVLEAYELDHHETITVHAEGEGKE
jgi:hypothetical protein